MRPTAAAHAASFFAASAALAAVCLAAPACTPPLAPGGDVALVTAFHASPTFNNVREVCAVRYTLAAPARVTLRVTVLDDPDGPGGPAPPERRLVATLSTDQPEPRGARSAAWRGVGPDGFFVPQGSYTVELTAARSGAASRAAVTWSLPTYLYRD